MVIGLYLESPSIRNRRHRRSDTSIWDFDGPVEYWGVTGLRERRESTDGVRGTPDGWVSKDKLNVGKSLDGTPRIICIVDPIIEF